MHLLLEMQLTGVVTGQVCPTVVKSAIKCPEFVLSCPNQVEELDVNLAYLVLFLH